LWSFYGIVDLLAILPGYLSVLLPGSQSLVVIRALRLLRIFRVLKLAPFLGGANVLLQALRASAAKVIVFLATLLVLVTIMGTAMYVVEGEEAGFTSIPRSIYWAIVTMTTVGYGDLTPRSVPGQALAAAAMIMGYSIIAVPTGIVSAEIARAGRGEITTRTCPHCMSEGHERSARFCRDCGAPLPGPGQEG
jgi:voltage-gated potassium channel